MNRYPLWKNILIIIVLLLGLLYTLPNFFGEAPAVQVSTAKFTLDIDPAADGARIDKALAAAGIEHNGIFSDAANLRVRFADSEIQLRAKDVIEREFNPNKQDPSYTVALNLLPNSPTWLTWIRALPMYLGLDLRGGVHFLLQVDMPGAVAHRLESIMGDLRNTLRDKKVRYAGIARDGETIQFRFHDAAQHDAAREAIQSFSKDIQLIDSDGGGLGLAATLSLQARQNIQDNAVERNIQVLNKRLNASGLKEPVIQRQGLDRIVVQLPGAQDVAETKDSIGRIGALELRMVEGVPNDALANDVAAKRAPAPYGTELYIDHRQGGMPILLRKQIELTGENLTDAQPGLDQYNQPAVDLTLDSAGARKFLDLTRNNVGKHMAIVLVDRGIGEVVTAPVIRSEIPNGRVQISGSMSAAEASKVSDLLRNGALAAPMEIIEERVVGPSLGAENIKKGFHSTLWGFLVIVLFMSLYYRLFGVISGIALAANLLLLVALLSLLQATLTLPGSAAMALTLGMAIDSNVLINERIREELRNGCTPQAAISAGYERAWNTILDSNVTTLIAGIALLIFGSGPVRGFAVVHCLGIITSMFSAILVSRMLVNFIHGHRKLTTLSIGQIWKPGNS